MTGRIPVITASLALAVACGAAAGPTEAVAAKACQTGSYRITARTHVSCATAKSILHRMRDGWACTYPSLNHPNGSCRGPGGARFRFRTVSTGPSTPPATPAPNVPAVP